MNLELIKKIFSIFSKIENDKTHQSDISEKIHLKLSKNDGIQDVLTLNMTGLYDTIKDEEKKKAFSELLSSQNLKSIDKKMVFLKMYGDCLQIHKKLIPIMKLDAVYEIDLVGGSVRDFLLNKHGDIRDLDILISVRQNEDSHMSHFRYNKYFLSKENIVKLNVCTSQDLENLGFDENDSVGIKLTKVINCLIKNEYKNSSEEIFNNDHRKIGTDSHYGFDILKPVSSIIKIKDSTLHYPVDLIITDHLKTAFLQDIDFGICNVGFNVYGFPRDKEGKAISYKTQLNSFATIENSFIFSEEFLKDYHEKTITFNKNLDDPEQVKLSMTHRIEKIKEKYPEYQMVIPQGLKNNAQIVINSILMEEKLSKDLKNTEKNDIKPAIKRNKI